MHFFTGLFRRPREVNWVFGWTLLLLGLFEGLFFGYAAGRTCSSGTGLRLRGRGDPGRCRWSARTCRSSCSAGSSPADYIVARSHSLQIPPIPGIMAALVVAHLILVVYHKHTQFAGPGKTERNVVGTPFLPVYLAKAAASSSLCSVSSC